VAPKGSSLDVVQLGYRVRKSAWGKGYATEGSRALIRKGFTELGVQRVMEKAGLRLARTYRMTPEELLAEGTYHSTSQDLWEGDDVEYALGKADWEQQEMAGRERFAGNT